MPNPPQFASPHRTASSGTNAPARFGEIDNVAVQETREADFSVLARSPEFQELRRRLRRFVFPMSALFLVWYLVYVLLAAYLPAFMSIRLAGEINVGLVMGIGQFVSTILITALYLRFASREIDPRVSRIRGRVGGGAPQ